MLNFPYREAVGALMWTATMTRPDIAGVVRAVDRFWKLWTGALLKDDDVGYMDSAKTMNFSCLGNRRLASGAVVILAKGGGQLAFEDTSSNGIR